MQVKKVISPSSHGQLQRGDIPGWVPAMKATLTHEYFSNSQWLYEHKLDGERTLIRGSSGQVIMFSRNQKQLNDTYPEVAAALKDIGGDWWLDGEIVAFEGGRTSFSKLQERMHKQNWQEARKSDVEVYLYLFDCMYTDGYDLRGLPLYERKRVLGQLTDYQPPLQLLRWRYEHGERYLQAACKDGWEGLIAKDAESVYASRRSRKWLKFKCDRQQELVVIGYTKPQGQRTYFGALLLGYYENDRLRYAGKVGTGFDEQTRADMMDRFSELHADSSPVAEQVVEHEVHWLKPNLVAQIGFSEWTQDGKLRHPRFLGLRRDKDPRDVVKEVA